MNPKLSIIVPVYNVEKYLEKCIDSILNQDYKNFELILVNDGSTDGSLEICKRYLSVDKRIKLINKPNGGLSSARNAGLDIACGQYIGFVDSDDWIEKDMYYTLLSIADKYKSDIVQCEYESVMEDNYKINNNQLIVTNFTNVQAIDQMYGDRYISSTVTWNKIYNKKLFETIRFPVGKLHEDEFTTYKLLYESKIVTCINKKLYYYRKTPNSIMNSKFSVKRLDIIQALEEKKIFIKSINNKRLYTKTIKTYNDMIINIYFACERDMLNNKTHLLNLKEIFNKNYYEILSMIKNFNFKHILKFTIFYISPSLYKQLERLK